MVQNGENTIYKIGKGEVESSIPSNSTIFPKNKKIAMLACNDRVISKKE